MLAPVQPFHFPSFNLTSYLSQAAARDYKEKPGATAKQRRGNNKTLLRT